MKLIEDLHAGKWVYGFDPDVNRMLLTTESLCFRLNTTDPADNETRSELIRAIFGHIEPPFTIHSPFHCDFGCHISAGRNLVANFNLTILDEAPVTIGDNVFIGPNCGLYTINHALLPEQRNAGVMRARPITIGDNVWLGANVTVLPGVSIGSGSVIGGGSVVLHDIPAGVLAAGNPCRVIRPITDSDRSAI